MLLLNRKSLNTTRRGCVAGNVCDISKCKLLFIMTLVYYLHFDQVCLYCFRVQLYQDVPSYVNIGFFRKKVPLSSKYITNYLFIRQLTFLCAISTFIYLITILIIILSGDVHPNPGPWSPNSSISSNNSRDFIESLSNGLSIMHLNIQSLRPKIDLLQAEMQVYDILIFTETWLSPNITDDEISIPNFQKPLRLDRANRVGGGVAIYIRDNLFATVRLDLQVPSLEALWAEVHCKNRKLLIGGFYRPPDTGNHYWDMIEESFDRAYNTNFNDIIITGDFNSDLNNTSSYKFNNLIQSYSFHQLISQPTHFTESSSTLLDVFLVKNTDSVLTSFVSDPFIPDLIRYHCPIVTVLKFSNPPSKCFKRTIFKYDQGDYHAYRNLLRNYDWSFICQSANLDSIVSSFTQVILRAAQEYVPHKVITVRPGQIPWLYSSVRKLIRQRKRLHKRAKKLNTFDAWAAFRIKRNETVKAIRKAKSDYLNNVCSSLNNPSCDSKTWYKLAKQIFYKSKNSDCIPTLIYETHSASTDYEKAELLNNYFCKQSSVNDRHAQLPEYNSSLSDDAYLNNIIITAQDVTDVLKNLKVGKASGPDCINPRLLKEGAEVLSEPLSKIFNLSIDKAYFPPCWKKAHVTPVFKKADPSSPCNYRPISLLSCISKVMERCIFKHLYNHLSRNNILTPSQSGFIPGDSTTNQLAYLYDQFCKALDDGKEIRCVFCDISKAFDRVWHKGLLFKLKSIGISDPLVNWFLSYLENRQQRVVLCNANSSWKNISAGVPQGSILGPLLFLVYINDIVNNIGSNIRLFADDTSLYLIVDSPTETATCLNSDLEIINKWSKQWLVDFNPSKTETMIISRKVNSPLHPNLAMNDITVAEVNQHKHLGLTLSTDGKWQPHISFIVNKAWQRLGLLRQFKFILNRNTLENLYFRFIRPILEYGDVVWCNCTLEQSNMIEAIQVEAARIVLGATKFCSIDKMYGDLKWEPLADRRRNHKLVLFFKMIRNLTPHFLSELVPRQLESSTSYNLRNAQDYLPVITHTSLYNRSFLPSVIREWNMLPQSIKDSETLSIFKSRLQPQIKSPRYFNYGNRKSQILHARLRLGCSTLNDDLYRRSLTNSPLCSCGLQETAYHFIFACPKYTEQRVAHLSNLPCQLTLNNILFGCPSLTVQQNEYIFESVFKYIISTKRFAHS